MEIQNERSIHAREESKYILHLFGVVDTRWNYARDIQKFK